MGPGLLSFRAARSGPLRQAGPASTRKAEEIP